MEITNSLSEAVAMLGMAEALINQTKRGRKAIPRNGETGPLKVHVGFYVESLGNFRSTEMTFDMDLYMYMSWQDIRMKHNQSDYVLINGTI
ncbi:hypothetical protein GCK32_020237 [Trichostrongylus colubriformis]|uniref:Neurotransmitter-gated ion-channel ligand-binding domain-containing protein n=1 Tax=Trichostrongylus colubriformis TaxID=6319 RepID=A0AAN8FTR9_TRICO